MKTIYNAKAFEVTSSGKLHLVTIDDEKFNTQILSADNGKLNLLVNGERVIGYVSSDGMKRWITIDGRTFVLTKSSTEIKRKGSSGDHAGELTAPMPGQVRHVAISIGEAVNKGQTLLIIEAMKMEIRIQAPKDGFVKDLHVKQGQIVEREQILIEVME